MPQAERRPVPTYQGVIGAFFLPGTSNHGSSPWELRPFAFGVELHDASGCKSASGSLR